MTLLESGPAKFDRNYWLVVCVVFVAVAAYFFYDGAAGYRNKNIAAAERHLLSLVDGPVEFGEIPSKKDYEDMLAARPESVAEVHKLLGQPVQPRPGVADGAELFISAYGMATVPIRNGRVDLAQSSWDAWGKSKEDIRDQYYWGLAVLIGAMYFLVRAVRAATLRATIDEEGLTYGGRRIVFADMKDLRDYNRKGWVDLYYQDGEREQRLRIDNQKIAKFEEIVALLCQRKGFDNPLTAVGAAEREGVEPGDDSQ
jgi:hypothetical protein